MKSTTGFKWKGYFLILTCVPYRLMRSDHLIRIRIMNTASRAASTWTGPWLGIQDQNQAVPSGSGSGISDGDQGVPRTLLYQSGSCFLPASSAAQLALVIRGSNLESRIEIRIWNPGSGSGSSPESCFIRPDLVFTTCLLPHQLSRSHLWRRTSIQLICRDRNTMLWQLCSWMPKVSTVTKDQSHLPLLLYDRSHLAGNKSPIVKESNDLNSWSQNSLPITHATDWLSTLDWLLEKNI